MKRISYLLLIIALCCTGCTAESSKESLPQVKRQYSSGKAMSTVADTTASKQDTEVVLDTTTSVQEEKVNNDTVSNDTTSVSESKPVVKEEQPKEKEKNKEGSSRFNVNNIMIYTAYALILLLFVVLIRSKSVINENLEEYKWKVNVLGSDVRDLQKKLSAINEARSSSVSSQQPKSNKVEAIEIVNLVSNDKVVMKRVPRVDETPVEQPKNVVLYLKNFKNGEMRECSKQESQYELHLNREDDSVGEFYFAGNPATAIATKDSTFAGVCDYDNWNTNSKTCHSVEKGRAQKISDGKWEATKKARVKCE